MGPYVIAAACGTGLAKLLTIKQTQDSLLENLSEGAIFGVMITSMPMSIALGVSTKVAAVATATFYLSGAFFLEYFIMDTIVPFAVSTIGGALTYATLASCGPAIAGIIGVAGEVLAFDCVRDICKAIATSFLNNYRKLCWHGSCQIVKK